MLNESMPWCLDELEGKELVYALVHIVYRLWNAWETKSFELSSNYINGEINLYANELVIRCIFMTFLVYGILCYGSALGSNPHKQIQLKPIHVKGYKRDF